MSDSIGSASAAALEQQLRANGEEALADIIAKTGDIAQRVAAGDLDAAVHFSPDQLAAITTAMQQIQAANE
ncbi:MAG: hypothetical protein KDD77_10725 [Caldilineaceae bacterium]|nr:hypothetical protein [Caldilineaceae bacterium]